MPSAFAQEQLVDLAELCRRVAISVRTGRRLIARREIGIVRVGGSIRIPLSEVERFLAARYVPPAETRSAVEVLDRMLPRQRGRPRII